MKNYKSVRLWQEDDERIEELQKVIVRKRDENLSKVEVLNRALDALEKELEDE